MKNIINGSNSFLNTSEIKFVDVPIFDELKPELVIESLKLKENKKLWK